MTPNKLEENIVKMLMERHANEMDAFYHYRAASNYCKNVGYFKAAEFFAAESEDELKHAKVIEDYLVDWNITPPLSEVPKPPLTYTSLLDVIETAYKMEYELYEAYEKTGTEMFKADLCTFKLVQDFLSIQLKAVAEYSDKLNMLEGVEPTKINLLLLEKKLF